MSVSNIKVVCRFRPENKLEECNNSTNIIKVQENGTSLAIDVNEVDNLFTYDKVFGWESTQKDIFDYSIKSTVEDVLKGYNGTVFAYGQTGSGKTYTMMGTEDITSDQRGIIPRIVQCIFQQINNSPETIEYTVNVSYMEIYMERIKDLLSPQNDNLPIHENKARGIYVKGLLEVYVTSVDEVFQVMKTGALARAVASTNMNSESSRSHSIFVITINQKNLLDGGSIKSGKLSLVDLAGSEKVGKTGASGHTLEEAKKINKSLSSLGMVINALTDGKSTHIPYRDSKLTRILQESLGGNSRTTLIINCSPSSFNASETMSTLRFGERAKKIQNKAKINQDLSPAELKAQLKKSKLKCLTFEQYISMLEGELGIWRNGGTVNKEDYVTMDKLLASDGPTMTKSVSEPPSSTTAMSHSEPMSQDSSSRSALSPVHFNAGINGDALRSWTPTTVGDEDSIEYFMKENVLTDLLNEKETEITELTRKYEELQSDILFLREQENILIEENKNLSTETTSLKVNQQKLNYQISELTLQNEGLKEEQVRLESELASNSLMNSPESFPTPTSSISNEKLTQMLNDLPSTSLAKHHERSLKHTRSQLTFYEMEQAGKSKGLDSMRSQLKEIKQREGDMIKENLILSQEKMYLNQKCELLEMKFKQLDEEMFTLIDSSQNEKLNLQEFKAQLEKRQEQKHQELLKDFEQLKDKLEIKERTVEDTMNIVDQLTKDNEKLRNKLTESEQQLANSSTINQVQIEKLQESMQKQLQEFENVKSTLAQDLVTRCEKIVELELALETALTDTLGESDVKQVKVDYQRKMTHLESQLHKVINIQRQLISQNQSLKRDISISDRKLDTRNDRIKSLESLLEDAQDRTKMMTDRFEDRIRNIREQYERSNNIQYGYNPTSNMMRIPTGFSSGASVVSNSSAGNDPPSVPVSRIAKPLRGGGKVGVNNIIIGSGGNPSTLLGGSVIGAKPRVKVRSTSISNN